ncbi:hypothetical protein CGCA056_v009507 [Colletotrichum aenigma]|uniref:uncharacterized protein n=1 Tax=Colletotrichum aenigma TaxID=1215731 RepID=UPI001872B456|nr:uncharacterized protein CGCA056_v009507 [Colletotrichum aenigma]KAF5519022.1 hypothetical protein CGCA056_v009507 [Colletotrichum aenigma]
MDDHEAQYHHQQLEWHQKKHEQQVQRQRQLRGPDDEGQTHSPTSSSPPPLHSPKSLQQTSLTTLKNEDEKSQSKQQTLQDEQPGLEPAPVRWSNAPIPYTPHDDVQSPAGQSSISQLYAVPVESTSPPAPSAIGKRRILGLSVPVFWGLVIALVIVLAAGLAGGVAGGLIAQKANASPDPTSTADSASSNPSTTTTAATSAAATAQASGSVLPAPTDGGCPTINSTTFAPLDAEGEAMGLSNGQGQIFRQLCEVNYPGGAAYGNPGIYDILKAYVSTFDECMTLCAAHNQAYYLNLGNGDVAKGGYCRSVAMIKTPGEYCYLKNGTGISDTFGHPKDFVSAVVVSGLDV